MAYYPYSYPYYASPQVLQYGSPYPASPQVLQYGSPYPAYPQTDPNQLYQAIDMHGRPIGEPARLPPISQQYYYAYPPAPDYNLYASAYVPPPPVPNVAVAPPIVPVAQPQVTPAPVTLPPIQTVILAPSRMVAPEAHRYKRYAVSDLTERGSVVSLSPREAFRSVQYYDQLRRSYH